ncbi:MAG: hypothetical protein V2A73_06825, partial [Pseudomonadota bacterium]
RPEVPTLPARLLALRRRYGELEWGCCGSCARLGSWCHDSEVRWVCVLGAGEGLNGQDWEREWMACKMWLRRE